MDDHPLVREWLTNLIHQQQDLVVCGESEDASIAVQEISPTKPDVAIVDISLKLGSGIEAIKNLQRLHPDVAIIVLLMHDERLWLTGGLAATSEPAKGEHKICSDAAIQLETVPLDGRVALRIATEKNK